MNDQELARALRAAVNIDHSPDFLARVRARVSVEQTRVWPSGWFFIPGAAAALAAVVVAAIALWPVGHHSVPAPPIAPVSGHIAPSVPSAPSAIQAPVRFNESPSNVVTLRHRRNSTRRIPSASRFPEVLIADEDARALRLLAASARDGRIPPSLLVDGASSDHVAVPPVEIPPVVVEPLPEIARLEGDNPS